MIDEPEKLGRCCTCNTTEGVKNIMMLNLRAPVPGKGWGCVVCGLAADGAVAVLCDACVDKPVMFVCLGYPAEDVRVPVADLAPDSFDHDRSKHPELTDERP